ncbi:MAG: hypothetical protein CME55_08620 [Halieaceae bacterium]|nr:hypothetical protein [Halieaceae bacterium]|tara:strand:- start:6723 stop:7454 length:732 start_codon:yes stop_codon:yes gene_type:complete
MHMQPVLIAKEDEDDEDILENYRAMVRQDRLIRIILTVFTGVLVFTAPVVSYLYPATWNIILSTALAFTIGTNLLISVVTVKVESKAQQLEERMQILVHELNQTADRMSGLHETLNIANIPGAIDLFETFRREFMPGFRSLEDVDLRSVSNEIKRASAFVDTLDKEKLLGLISQFTKSDIQPGVNPYDSFEGQDEWYFEDEVETLLPIEEDFEFDDTNNEDTGFAKVPVFDRDSILAKLGSQG